MGRGTLRTIAALLIGALVAGRDAIVAAKDTNIDLTSGEGLTSFVIASALAFGANWLISKVNAKPDGTTTTASTRAGSR
jgi:hypothetical protein